MSATRFKTINATKRIIKRIKSGNKFQKNKILPSKITIVKSKNDNKNKFNLKRGINKKNFSINLLRRCQMKYNSFIKKNRDVTMYGTKRYENKSGSYYLQNLSKDHMNQKSIASLKINNKNQYNKNKEHIYFNSNKDIIQSKKKTIPKELNQNTTTEKHKTKMKEEHEKKNAFNTIGNTKFLRRYQYSNNITQKQIKQYKEMKKKDKIFLDKLKFIQIWWKTIFQVIKIQKYIRGYLYRTKLISSLEEKEDYIDKVLYMIKAIKKIYLFRLYNQLVIYKPGKQYYFYKWNEVSSKKLILKKITSIYSSMKNEENYFFTTRITKDNNFTKENDDIVSENEFYKIPKTNREENINKSILGIYANRMKNQKIKKRQKKSSSSYALRTKKKDINVEIKISSSQILKRTKIIINDLGQNDYKPKNKAFINNNIINEIENVKKNVTKRNKSNKQQKFNNKNKFNSHNKNLLKEGEIKKKFSKDLKSIKCINNKTIDISKKNNTFNKNSIYLTKSSNKTLSKNLHVNTKRKEDFSKKNSKNTKKVHNYSISNVTNYSENLYNKSKNKKIKIYENELTNYNKNINSGKNNIYENQFLSIDKEQLEKLLPYTERVFDVSQFSALLDNSSLNNNKNAYNNDDKKQVNYNPKNIGINSFIYTESLILQENTNNNNNKNDENIDILKNYFSIWVRKTILRLLLNHNNKRFYSGGNILIKLIFEKYSKIFFSNFKQIYNLLILKEVSHFFDKYKMKIIIEKLRLFGNKYLLIKYFNYYRSIIDKSIIIQNIIQYRKYLGLKSKDNKISKESILLCSDCDLGNKYYDEDFPINNNINNIFNINNNSNNCYIINNLNYNNYNNEINIGLSNKTNSNSNSIPSKNNKRTFGVIRSKIIEFPKNSCKKYETISPISDNDYWNNNIANLNTIDNSNLFRNNTQRTIRNKNSDIIDINKEPINNQESLCKSIITSNNLEKSDLVAQTNQLMMVINIIENHRKFQTKNLFLVHFKKWKNQINIIQNININSADNIKIKSIKIQKNQNKLNNCEVDNIINSYGISDNKEITKNTIDSEDLRTEYNSKNENKKLTKSHLIQNNKINLEQNNYYTSSTYNFQENKFTTDIFTNKSLKGVYKKKTIGGSANKSICFFKKNSLNNSFNQNNYLFPLTNTNPVDKIHNNTILNNFNVKEFDFEDNKNVCKIGTMSDKNLDLFLQNNNIEMSGINLKYTTPEENFGFKKVNKIEEMEVSFLPLNENKILISNNENDEDVGNGNNNINNININNERNEKLNNIDNKEVIIEDIEEYNEYENIINRIKKEFENYEEKLFYKTYDNINKNGYIDFNKEKEKNLNNKSMINFS